MDQVIGLGQILNHELSRIAVRDSLSVLVVLQKLVITFLLGLFIFWIYKRTFKGIVYSHRFNVSLIMLALITCLVIMAITSNIILSLGMVGALSIVRFRNAIKDPVDITFMFWAIAIGLTVGAGFVILAVVGSVFIGGVMSWMIRFKFSHDPYLLILQYHPNSEANVLAVIKQLDHHRIKSKTTRETLTELVIETRLKDGRLPIQEDIQKIDGVSSQVLLTYDSQNIS